MNRQCIEVDYCNRAQSFKWLWATVSFVQCVISYYVVSEELFLTPVYLVNLILYFIGTVYYVAALKKHKVFPNNVLLMSATIAIILWMMMAHTVTVLWNDNHATEKVLLLGFFSILMCFNASQFMLIACSLPIIAMHVYYQVTYVEQSSMSLLVSTIKYPFFVIAMITTHVNHNTRLVASHRKLVDLNKELTILRNVDDLTSIFNRRAFDEKLKYLLELQNRNKQPVSLMLLDVDFFKRYNDSLGHLQGDKCLKEVAHAMSIAVKRETDIVARVGGEEFGIILPNTDIEDCQLVAQKVIEALKEKKIFHPNSSVSSYVTASIGCACIQGSITTPEVIYHRADKALYSAKELGRNRYCV